MNEIFNLDKNNIIEICIPIIIAVLSLSYPIILDKISSISDKYSSISILEFFENEFFQKKHSCIFLNERWTINRIEIIFSGTLLSLLLLFLDYDLLLFRWIIFIMTVILYVSFYMWFDKVITYNNGVRLFKYFTEKYKESNIAEEREVILKCLKELSIYASNKGDKNFEKLFHEFFYEILYNWRIKYSKENIVTPIEYTTEYYEINQILTEVYLKKSKTDISPLANNIIIDCTQKFRQN